MNRHKWLVVAFVALAVPGAILISGCGSSSTSSSPAGYTQDLKDSDTVWAVNTEMVSIYNNNLAGKPTGGQNLSGVCALGGTVGITGSTTYAANTGITTVDLTYALTGCKFTSASGSLSATLTMNGTMTHKGSFKSGYKDEIYQSSGGPVSIAGTLSRTGYVDATIDETCDYYAQSKTNSVTGSICGRNVSWTF